MPGQRGTEKRKLNHIINVRLPSDVFRAIQVQAHTDGVSDTTAARRILAAGVRVSSQDVPTVPRRPPPFIPPPEIVRDLRMAREAAAEATGMLVNAATRYRFTGMVERHAEAEAILCQMRRAAGEFLDLADEITRAWREVPKT